MPQSDTAIKAQLKALDGARGMLAFNHLLNGYPYDTNVAKKFWDEVNRQRAGLEHIFMAEIARAYSSGEIDYSYVAERLMMSFAWNVSGEGPAYWGNVHTWLRAQHKKLARSRTRDEIYL